MKDLLIGAIHKLPKEEVEVWYKSARASGFDGDIILLVYSEPEDVVRKISEDGVLIVKPQVDHLNRPNTQHIIPVIGNFEINRLRFYDIWGMLVQMESQYRYVVTTDVRDVVFQSNPFVWLEHNIGEHGLVVGAEALTYEYTKYNARDMKLNFGPFVYEYGVKKSSLVCCGVLAGTAKAIKNTSLMMYLMATGCQDYAEQAALNVMLNSGWDAKVTTLDDGFIAHCALPFDRQFADEWPHMTSPRPVWNNGVLSTLAGRPYVIVHQYNRIPGAVEAYRKRFA